MKANLGSKSAGRGFAKVLVAMLSWGYAQAADYYVATNGNDGAAGTSWAAAFLTIQKAMDTATAGQSVAVSNGTYVLTTQLLLNKGITVTGAGGSTNTIIDASTSNRVITISSSGAVLDGFTLLNGSIAGSGGGVSMSAGEVRNCVVSNNVTTKSGSLASGGGVYMTGGLLRDSAVVGNRADPYYGDGRGGGVYVSGGAIVTNCLVGGNLIDNGSDLEQPRGGGLYVSDGTVVDCRITYNKVNTRWRNSSYGGGVYLDHVNALLDRCIVSYNEAAYLAGFDTGRFGGGVAIHAGTARNSLISGNQARNQAGGVWMDGGTLENCTIVRNAAVTADYGGVFRGGGTVQNCIVWNNTSVGVVPNITNDTLVTYSCAPSLTSGTGNTPNDPLFNDTGAGSGTSFTPGDYRTVIGGPCSGTGLISDWMSSSLDLAGLSRKRGALVDMGAYAAVQPASTFVAETGNDGNAGTNWATAFLTIQKGINSATALGTVSVSNGTYVLSTQLSLGKACTVLGVGGRDQTIINANGSGRVLAISSSAAVVDGFTLKNGSSATALNGTGVNMTGGTLRNCTVSACTNTAANYAGTSVQGVGVYMSGGTVDSCTIVQNIGSPGINDYARGGGIYVAGSGCLVTNCLISGNYIGNEYVLSKGGGVYLAAGSLLSSVVSNNTVNAGRSGIGGGGVFVTGGGIVSNCLISANAVTVVDTITRGGGVYVDWGSVVDCVLSNNSAAGWYYGNYAAGGGLYITNAALVERCVITRNYLNTGYTAYRYGGGVYSDGGTMRSCLIMGNTANTEGGGLYMTGGTNENCTIVRNAGGNCGGVYWTNTPVIVNAIVYNNTGGVENNILPVAGGVSAVTYSCAPSLSSGTGNRTGDPLFTASGSGSGTTFTPGNYRLMLSSPCRDVGYTEDRMRSANDLDLLPRIKAWTVDMGAYEVQADSGTVMRIM